MRASVLCSLVVCGLASAQEPLPLELLPSDSSLVFGINVAGVLSSKMGQSLMDEIKRQSAGQLNVQGVDMLRDIQEVVFATAAGNQKGRGVLLMRCTCGDTMLSALSQGRHATVREARGVKVHTYAKDGQSFSVACLKSSLLAGGDPESLQGLLNPIPGVRLSGAMVAQANTLRQDNDLWMVSAADLSRLAAEVPGNSAAAAFQSGMMRSVDRISAGIKLRSGMELALTVTAKTGQDAETMAGAMLMIAGMAKSDPKSAKQIGPLLDNLNVRAEGTNMQLTLNLTESQLDDLARQMKDAFAAGLQQGSATPQSTEVVVHASPSAGGEKAPAAAAPARPAQSGGVVVHSSGKDMGVVTLPSPK